MANLNNRSVKRIMAEAKELCEWPADDFVAGPLEDNLFEWHFTLRGAQSTPFEGGAYHGRIVLPFEYPFKPPSIYLLTPNGRFETGKKICLSISAHHPESWQPAWGVRTILTALIAFFPTNADGALAGLDYSDAERRSLADRSTAWRCPKCDCTMAEALPPRAVRGAGSSTKGERGSELQAVAAEAAKQLTLFALPPAGEAPGAPSGGAEGGETSARVVPGEGMGDAGSAALCSAASADSTSDGLGGQAVPELSAESKGASMDTGLPPAAAHAVASAEPPPTPPAANAAALLSPMLGLPPEAHARSLAGGVPRLAAATQLPVGSASRQPDWLGLTALALIAAIAALFARKVGLFAGCEEEVSWTESCSLSGGGGH
jgi:ubiquitin-conjugating enzyme E2 J1